MLDFEGRFYMNVIFILVFLISLVLLPLGLIKPSLLRPITRKILSRKQVGLIFGGLLIVSMVVVIATTPAGKEGYKSGSQTGTPQTTSPAPSQSPSGQKDLDVSVKFNDKAFLITNNESKDLANCRMKLNSGTFGGGGFAYTQDIIQTKDAVIVPYGAFTKDDGTRFDFITTQPKNLFISCDMGSEHATNYFTVK